MPDTSSTELPTTETAQSRRERKEAGRLKKRQRIQESGGRFLIRCPHSSSSVLSSSAKATNHKSTNRSSSTTASSSSPEWVVAPDPTVLEGVSSRFRFQLQKQNVFGGLPLSVEAL